MPPPTHAAVATLAVLLLAAAALGQTRRPLRVDPPADAPPPALEPFEAPAAEEDIADRRFFLTFRGGGLIGGMFNDATIEGERSVEERDSFGDPIFVVEDFAEDRRFDQFSLGFTAGVGVEATLARDAGGIDGREVFARGEVAYRLVNTSNPNSEDARAHDLLANLSVHAPLDALRDVEPFVGVGLGASVFEATNDIDEADVAFAFGLFGGVGVPVSERVGLEFRLDYTFRNFDLTVADEAADVEADVDTLLASASVLIRL